MVVTRRCEVRAQLSHSEIVPRKMDEIKNLATGLGRELHLAKDSAEQRLTGASAREDPDRGGSNEVVQRRILDLEEPSSSDSNEENDSKLIQAKTLDELFDSADPPEIQKRYGRLPALQPNEGAQYERLTPLYSLPKKSVGDVVTFRARIHVVRRMSPGLAFIVFREKLTTVQGVIKFREGEVSKSMVQWAEHIRSGSIVRVKGQIQKAEQAVRATTFESMEVLIDEIHLVVERTYSVPFSVYEAEAATDVHAIGNSFRLANRILDLRTPTSQAIFRLQSGICSSFRMFLSGKDFLEIHTPKLQGGATEGGSDVFTLDYFGRPAFLAQSPQLAKQMCISADFGRVFEIGPVFRAGSFPFPSILPGY